MNITPVIILVFVSTPEEADVRKYCEPLYEDDGVDDSIDDAVDDGMNEDDCVTIDVNEDDCVGATGVDVGDSVVGATGVGATGVGATGSPPLRRARLRT